MATKKIIEVDTVNSLSDSDTIFVNSSNSLKQISKSNLVMKGDTGKSAYQYAQEGGYTGTEEKFAAKLAQEQLTGTTNDLTPTQVYQAVSAGIPVKVQYIDGNFGIFSYTNFNIAENMNAIAANTIVYYNSVYMLGELIGNKRSNEWFFFSTVLAQKTDIPSALPNPNALTFTGAVTGSYDGSAPLEVAIPSGGGTGGSGGGEWQTILTGETTVEAVTTVTIPMTASDFDEYRAVIVVGKNTDGTTTNNNTNIWIDGYCCAYYMLSINYGNYNGTFSISVEPIPETRILNNNGSYTSCAKKSNVDWWMTSPHNGGSSGTKAIFCSNTSPTGVLRIQFGTAYSGTIIHEVMAR